VSLRAPRKNVLERNDNDYVRVNRRLRDNSRYTSIYKYYKYFSKLRLHRRRGCQIKEKLRDRRTVRRNSVHAWKSLFCFHASFVKTSEAYIISFSTFGKYNGSRGARITFPGEGGICVPSGRFCLNYNGGGGLLSRCTRGVALPMWQIKRVILFGLITNRVRVTKMFMNYGDRTVQREYPSTLNETAGHA